MSDITPTLTRRMQIESLENEVRKHPMAITDSKSLDELFQLKHTFSDGIYIREGLIPKNTLIIGKIHKGRTLNFLMKGEITVLTEDGIKRLKAPLQFVSPAGSKKVGFTHEDTIWVNVHATQETDLVKIEEEVILPSYNNDFIDVQIEENKIILLSKESVCGQEQP